MENQKDPKVEKHLNTILLREAKLIVKNYEAYLLDRITSKQLAEKMLSLSHIIERIDDFNS